MTYTPLTQRTFDVNVPPELRTLYPDATGAAEATYIVKNTRDTPVRGKVRLVPKEGTNAAWLIAPQNEERDFRPGEAQQFKVGVKLPAGQTPGTYGFRLDVANVANPQEDFTEGDVVAFTVTPKPGPTPNGGPPKWLIPVIAVLVLLIVGGIILGVVLSRGIKVPQVTGLELDKAEKALTDAGLTLGKVTEGQKAGTTTGIIFEQKPDAGSKAKKGAAVDLTVQGDPPVALPDVKGKKLADVQTSLEQAGLVVKVVSAREGSAAPGTILKQAPDPGNVPPKTDVTLTVQAAPDPVAMPNLVGQTLDNAVARLATAGIPFNKKPVVTGRSNPNQVVQQSIAANAPVPPGTTVTLDIEGVAVPALKGMPIDKAKLELRNRGLGVGTATGTVVNSTFPAAGAPALLGTPVNINSIRTWPGGIIVRPPLVTRIPPR
jgi:beta-lactam-binding protein with PASTA domain